MNAAIAIEMALQQGKKVQTSIILRISFCVIGLFLASQSLAIDAEISGKLTQGGFIKGRVGPGVTVSYLNHKVSLTAQGDFIVGLGREAPEVVVLTLQKVGQAAENKFINVKKRQYDIQYINGVDQDKVTPAPERLERIRRENEMIGKIRQTDSQRTDFLKAFHWPAVGKITGVYGSQRYYNGLPLNPHFGVDIAGPVGTEVMAPLSGLVTLVHNDMFYSGGTLVVDHGHGISSTFIHLSKILVKVGDEITLGQAIAKMGATGRATGPHLDWRINWFEQRLDPELFVGPMPQIKPEPAAETASQVDLKTESGSVIK